MALTFPLPKTFFAALRIRSVSCELAEARVQSGRTAGQKVLTASSGYRLWTGTVELVPMHDREALGVMAKLAVLQQPGASLLISPVPGHYPAGDPDGSRLGDAAPTLSSVGQDAREARILGLPRGYSLSAGDAFSCEYGTDHSYHRIVTDQVMAGGSQTPVFEVIPPLPPAVNGAKVTLLRPAFKAILQPGTLKSGASQGGITSGITFDYIQT